MVITKLSHLCSSCNNKYMYDWGEPVPRNAFTFMWNNCADHKQWAVGKVAPHYDIDGYKEIIGQNDNSTGSKVTYRTMATGTV